MNQMEELEKLVSEGEPEPAPDNSPLDWAKYIYHAAVIIIDAVTAYMVGELTIWYYGVVWFLANALVFFIHHRNWERAENNEKQNSNTVIGMIVSVASMFILAIVSGGLYLTETRGAWVQIGIEVFAVTLFFYHGISIAVYRFTDDKWVMDRQIAKARANANKKIQITEAAGKVIDANKKVLAKRNEQYSQHGRQVVDKALAKVSNQDFRPAMASETEAVKEVNPTQPPRKSE